MMPWAVYAARRSRKVVGVCHSRPRHAAAARRDGRGATGRRSTSSRRASTIRRSCCASSTTGGTCTRGCGRADRGQIPNSQRRCGSRSSAASAISRPSRASTAPSTCPGSCRHDGGGGAASAIPVGAYLGWSGGARRVRVDQARSSRPGGAARPRPDDGAGLAGHPRASRPAGHAMIHGNVRNDGLIDNLPDGRCVEVPALVDPPACSRSPSASCPRNWPR